jgi:hypothetical protein
VIEGAFDNSQYNLGNPDPDATVRGGAQSWDEKFIGYFSYHKTRKRVEPWAKRYPADPLHDYFKH